MLAAVKTVVMSAPRTRPRSVSSRGLRRPPLLGTCRGDVRGQHFGPGMISAQEAVPGVEDGPGTPQAGEYARDRQGDEELQSESPTGLRENGVSPARMETDAGGARARRPVYRMAV